jgi:hypothetical protein
MNLVGVELRTTALVTFAMQCMLLAHAVCIGIGPAGRLHASAKEMRISSEGLMIYEGSNSSQALCMPWLYVPVFN